ncbi:ABC-type transport auxiliary lipoprotein family protein [Ottowia sp.]|uniref:ABC-type transport auxiliary lipoprotein family protein n=1 Tax=Ottowia sp. TaxID=1898956 RepID=UPI002621E826|nr:ABC-type transport auxiliary lipoprotein family protein [Ottowia sp.]
MNNMKTIAACARRTWAGSVFCLGLLALGGCALPLPDKPTRPEPYDLGPPLAAAAAPAGAAPLALQRVEASAAIDGTAVVYRLLYAADGAQQPRPYAQARWVMSPPQLVTQRLREALTGTRPVVEPGLGLAGVALGAELQEFAQNFSAPGTSEGVVQLRVTVTAPGAASERLLGQRSFVARKPAPSADAAGGAQALRQATDDVVAQVVAWVNGLPAPR